MHQVARNVAGRLHVSASSRDVIRAALKAIKKKDRFARRSRDQRHMFIRLVLKTHGSNREVFANVMRGSDFIDAVFFGEDFNRGGK